MTSTHQKKDERQNVTQMYRDLSTSNRVIFKSILEMAIILLKNMQVEERKFEK